MTELTDEQRDNLLGIWLPYHAQGLILWAFANQQREKLAAGQDAQFTFGGTAIASNIVLNALDEAGAVHLRFLAEFLGLKVSDRGKTPLARKQDGKTDLRISHLSDEALIFRNLTWEGVESDPNMTDEFASALAACLSATNKLMAHPTFELLGDGFRVEMPEVRVAVEGTLALLLNHIYAPLGLQKEFIEHCPGIEKLVR